MFRNFKTSSISIFSIDSKYLAAGILANKIFIYDIVDCIIIKKIIDLVNYPTVLNFIFNLKYLAAGIKDTSVII